MLVEGCESATLDVLSGGLQGTVLGPLLFLVYINDLPEVVSTSTLRLFADDSLLYRQVKNQSDSNDFQKDLSALEEWENKWYMCFHPTNCTVIRISTNRRNVQDTH